MQSHFSFHFIQSRRSKIVIVIFVYVKMEVGKRMSVPSSRPACENGQRRSSNTRRAGLQQLPCASENHTKATPQERATSPSSPPTSVRMVSVMADPFPARVLMTPARVAPMRAMKYSIEDLGEYARRLLNQRDNRYPFLIALKIRCVVYQ